MGVQLYVRTGMESDGKSYRSVGYQNCVVSECESLMEKLQDGEIRQDN